MKELQGCGNEKLFKFNQPAIQIATRKAALGYILSGESCDRENFLDLLIERVNVEEHSTKQHIVDMAIQIKTHIKLLNEDMGLAFKYLYS